MRRYGIRWKTRDRNLINRVCSYLDVPAFVNVNRVTEIGTPSEEKLKALEPLKMNGSISILVLQNNP